MDIEWAKDGHTGELFILQARPETVQSQKSLDMVEVYHLEEKGPVLVRGRSVGEKIAHGPVRVVKSAHNLNEVQKGDVLVTDKTDPDWEPTMKKAAAIVTNRGGRTCHESGHAIVAELVPGADPVSKISIIPRGLAALGYTQQLPTEDRYLMTRSELLARIHVLLGGRVAEEMIFRDVSTGAQNDLQKATEIARTMVTQFGMSEKIGLVSLEGPRTPLFLPVPTHVPKEYSEETAHLVDIEVKKILSETHEKVTEILLARRQALDVLAKLLLEKEVIERPQLQAILGAGRLEDAA